MIHSARWLKTHSKQAVKQNGCHSRLVCNMVMQAVTLPALLQQKSVARQTAGTLELADASKAAFTEQDDPVNPFTLFGTTRYKQIDHLLCTNIPGFKSHCQPASKQELAGLACIIKCELHNVHDSCNLAFGSLHRDSIKRCVRCILA